jgi:hypothetical protein|tara:strand:+ start:339 stop:1301 length:963 start_codon:yes stop_codon:yes gene_type:complete
MKKVVWLLRENGENGRQEHSSAINWWYGTLEALGYEVVYKFFPDYGYSPSEFDMDGLYEDCKAFGADIVLHVAYEKVHPELQRLQDFAKVYVVQSDDDWRFDFAKEWTPYINGNISHAGKLERYLEAGVDKEKFIPTKWCFNPNTMPVNGEFKKDIFLSHAGGLHADRVQLLNEFQAKGLNPQCATNCFYEEIKQLWTRSRYSLCFTKNSVLTGTQAKGRVSEIPYFTVMLSQWFDGIEEYYEPDKEFILFETVDEAISKIKYYEENQDEYKKIFEAGRKRLLSTGTSYHRWNNMMHRIDPDFKKVDVTKILEKNHGIKI